MHHRSAVGNGTTSTGHTGHAGYTGYTGHAGHAGYTGHGGHTAGPGHPGPAAAAGRTGPGTAGAGHWRAFGGRLRHWRRRNGLTQAQLAAAVGYDHTAISKLEHGTRRATPRLADRLDELLGADGELAAACRAAEEQEEQEGHTGPRELRAGGAAPGAVAGAAAGRLTRPPLPGTPGAPGAAPFPPSPGLPAPLAALLPARLPDYGLLCPLHGADGCPVPGPSELIGLHAEFCAPDGSPAAVPDADTVHALAGLLAVHLRAGEEDPEAGTAAVEHTLRAVVRRLAHTRADPAGPLARLAAEYAHAAGGLRMRQGRNATAMACFDRALTWAELVGDPGTQVAALSDMSTLARLEGDAATSLGYARAIRRAAPGRHWAGAMAQVYQARAHALAGDVRETVRHIARARLHLDHIGDRDESDAPWLSIASMQLRVESGAAAALRDVAAAVGDRRLAHRAVDAAQTALRLLDPAQLPTARLLFTIRIADCHLCADDPEAAVAVLAPALAEVTGELPALVDHELRGVRRRLAREWGGRAGAVAALVG